MNPCFGVLGPLLIRDDSGVLELPGRRRRSILIRLLASANHPVVPDRLIEDVWDGRPPEGASQTLQSHISALRRLLGGDIIRYSAGGYIIDIAEGELDVDTFERGEHERIRCVRNRRARAGGDVARRGPRSMARSSVGRRC